jgi:LssY-like putative type I secretion system component LssY
MRAFVLALLAVSSLFAAGRIEIDINASQVWTDTGIQLNAGDSINITAVGSIQLDYTHATGPEGLPRSWGDLTSHYPVINAGRGALIAKFSDNPAARPFAVGPWVQRNVPAAGRLYLGVNEPNGQAAAGSFRVTVQWGPVNPPPVAYYPVFPQDMLDSIPGRVTDLQGNLSERVNFIVVGTREKLQAALSDGGWMMAEKDKKGAVLHGLIATLSKESYVAIPMSERMLFDRLQDFGYLQGDPLKVVMARHQFRLWQTPYMLYGKPVWAGAGAHDVGFDKNFKENGLAHKIDPATDGERDYIGQSIQLTGYAVKEDYMMPGNPVQQARTANGSGFISDGRTLIVFLQP